MNLHQAEIATRLGVTKAAYAAWESGRTEPRSILAVAKRIEAMTGIPAAWVLGVDSPTPPVTGIETDRYSAASARGGRPLRLVSDVALTNCHVAPGYGSSRTPTRCDASPDVPRSARTVNLADAA